MPKLITGTPKSTTYSSGTATCQQLRSSKILANHRPQQFSVCTNRTCKKQGSEQVAKFAEDLGIEGLEVERTGCLAKCGNGPNMVLSPLNVTLSHVNTVAKMREVLRDVGGYEIPDSLLKATELRLAGNGEARSGRLAAAAELYTQGIALEPPYGKHLLLANRSGVLLSLGRTEEAARDADQAASLSPAGFHKGYIRQVEAHSAQLDYATAITCLHKAAEQDPAFARTAEYRDLHKQLEAALQRV